MDRTSEGTGKKSDSQRRRAGEIIGRAAQFQRKATAEALEGRRSIRRLLNMARDALSLSDETIERVNGLVPPPRPIACGPGCPYCCHVRVTASPPEVLLIADHVRRNWSAERVATLKHKLANLDQFTRGRDDGEREAMRLPCPALVDNSCGVHDVRPTSCRGVASADVEACRRSYASRMEEPVPLVALQATAADAVGYGILAGLTEAGFPLENVELIAGLRIALETEDAARLWLDGEPVFAAATTAVAPRP